MYLVDIRITNYHNQLSNIKKTELIHSMQLYVFSFWRLEGAANIELITCKKKTNPII